MKKYVKFISLIIIICLILQPVSTILAYTGIQAENNNSSQNSEYGRAYQEWLKLTEKEKSKVLEPSKYDIPFYALGGSDGEEELEDYYNLAEIIDIEVEDQGTFGICWAFAANTTLETNIALTQGELYDFSEMHLGQVTGGMNGASFEAAMGYWIRGNGPVLESDVEYRDYEESEMDYLNSLKPIKQIDESQVISFPTIYKDTATELEIEATRNAIKNHIKTYGSVSANIMFSETEEDFEQNGQNTYFNPETNALYYNIDNFEGLTNHAISLVGWDDSYSKYNFAEGNQPEQDGAYIALNSWGEGWGNEGYFYISYEDLAVETRAFGVTEVREAYQIERQGWRIDSLEEFVKKDITEVKQLVGSQSTENTIWIKFPTYVNTENNNIYKIGILAEQGANCEIYLKNEQIGQTSNDIYTLLRQAENLQEGLNIIDLDINPNITDELLYIYVKYEGQSIYVSDYFQNDLESYIPDETLQTAFSDSIEGNWEFATYEKEEEEFGMCVYGYEFPVTLYVTPNTNYIELGSITPTNQINIGQTDTIFELPLSVKQKQAEEVDIVVTSKGEDVTDLFTITGTELDELNSTTVQIALSENIEAGTYLIAISYSNSAILYKAITITDLFSLGEINSFLWWGDEPYWKYDIYMDIYDKNFSLNEENITILYGEEDVTNQFVNIEMWKDSISTFGEIIFERTIENSFPIGTYTVKVEYGEYSETTSFTIGEDLITKIKQYEGEEGSYFDLDTENVVIITNIETKEELIINGYDFEDEKFANLENNNCYELKIYRNARVTDRLNFPYYKYAKAYIYKDEQGNKYFRATPNGENLETMTMINCLPNGNEDTNSYIEMSIENNYGGILLKDLTTDDIWIEGAETTYNTVETYILQWKLEEFLQGVYPADDTQEVIVLNPDGTEVAEGKYIGTGMKVKLGDRNWEIIVSGDIDGNGDLTSTDISRLILHIIETTIQQNAYEIAADYNNDGKVSLTDLSQMKDYLVKSE